MNPISVFEQTGVVNIVIRVAAKKDGQFLVVQEGKPDCYGKWSFPGGKLDMGESVSEAAIREVYEETAVKIRLTGVVGVRHGLWDNKKGHTIELFLMGEAVELPDTYPVSAEILAAAWKSLPELKKLKETGELRNASQEAIITYLESGQVLPISHLFENITEYTRIS